MPTDVIGYITCRRTSMSRKLSLREMEGDFCLIMKLRIASLVSLIELWQVLQLWP